MATYKQSYRLSCGAATLLCVAQELGVQQINHTLPLKLNHACEIALYRETCSDRITLSPSTWGYSMPSNLISCARKLGLQAYAIAERTWSVRALKIGYQQELDQLRKMHALVEPASAWWQKRRSSTVLSPHQRILKVIMLRNLSNFGLMHYILLRPNGTVMEPWQGREHANIQSAKYATEMHGTGLSIMIER